MSSPRPPDTDNLLQWADEFEKSLTSQPTAVSPKGGKAEALRRAAQKLGVDAADLGSIISFETGGSFDPHKVGGEANKYKGLIQFGPDEQRRYYNPKDTFETQVEDGVVRYFQDRFKKAGKPTQGATLEDLYTTVIAGNPGANRNARDSFGTSARSGTQRILKEHRPKVLQNFFGGQDTVAEMFDVDSLMAEANELAGSFDTTKPSSPTLPGQPMSAPVAKDILPSVGQPQMPSLADAKRPENVEYTTPTPVPESPQTLNYQAIAARDANSPRLAVLLTDETQLRVIDPATVQGFVRVNTPQGILLVNPNKAKAKGIVDIDKHIAERGIAGLIGKATDVGDETAGGWAVVSVAPDGTELSSSIVKGPEDAKIQADLDKKSFGEGITQKVVPAQEVVQARQEQLANDPALQIQTLGGLQGGENLAGSPIPAQQRTLSDIPVDGYQQWLQQNGYQDDQYAKEAFRQEQIATAQEGQFVEEEPRTVKQPVKQRQTPTSTNKESLSVQNKGIALTDPGEAPRPAPKDEKVTLQWSRGGDVLTNALDQAATEYSNRIGVDYDLVRERMKDMQPRLTPERAEQLRRERKPYTVTLEAATVRELQDEQDARRSRKGKSDTDFQERIAKIDPNLSPEERELEEMRLRGLADADAGLRSHAEVAETYEKEKAALEEWKKQNPETMAAAGIADPDALAISAAGGGLTLEQARSRSVAEDLQQKRVDREAARQKAIKEFGSLAGWRADQDASKKAGENLAKNTSPLFAAIVKGGRKAEAVVGGAVKAVPDAVASIAETIAIAQEAVGKALGTSDVAATERVAHKFGQDVRGLADEFIKIHKDEKDGLFEQGGNVFGQIALMVGTGGATSYIAGGGKLGAKLGAAFGAAQAGSLGSAGQYTEATNVMRQNLIDQGMTKEQANEELKKSNLTRLGASGTGFVLSASDYVLLRGWLGAAKGAEKIGFFRNFKKTITDGLVVKGLTRAEAAKAATQMADDIVSRGLSKAGGYLKSGVGEAAQESLLEAKGNDLYAYMTYDQTPERKAQLLSYTDENKVEGAMGFLGGLFGKKIGSIVQELQQRDDAEVKQIADALRLVPDVPKDISAAVFAEAKRRNISVKPSVTSEPVRTFTDKKGNKFELVKERPDGKLELRNEKGGIVTHNNDRRLTETTNETTAEVPPQSAQVEAGDVLPTAEVETPTAINEDVITPKTDINEDIITPKQVKEPAIVSGQTVTREGQQLEVERRKANTNPKTGLGSDNAWKAAQKRIEADPEQAIISLDINRMKEANDTTSHDTVDEKVLKHLGEVTRKVLEANNINVRNSWTPGGDELYVAVKPILAKKVRDQIEKEFGTVEIIAEKDVVNDRTGEKFSKGDRIPVTLAGTYGQTLKKAESGLSARKAESKAKNPVVRGAVGAGQTKLAKEISKEEIITNRPTLTMGDIKGMAPENRQALIKEKDVSYEYDSESGDIFAFKNGQEVGFATGLSNDPKQGFDVSVAQEYQRQGIGSKLFTLYREKHPNAPMGGLTQQGRSMVSAIEQRVAPKPTTAPAVPLDTKTLIKTPIAEMRKMATEAGIDPNQTKGKLMRALRDAPRETELLNKPLRELRQMAKEAGLSGFFGDKAELVAALLNNDTPLRQAPKPTIAEVRAERVAKIKGGKVKSLSQFVRQFGGIKSSRADKGEVGRVSNKELRTSGLINKGGMSAEQMAQTAWEHGYLRDQFSDISEVDGNAFLGLVEDDVTNGGKHFSTEDDFDTSIGEREMSFEDQEFLTADNRKQREYLTARLETLSDEEYQAVSNLANFLSDDRVRSIIHKGENIGSISPVERVRLGRIGKQYDVNTETTKRLINALIDTGIERIKKVEGTPQQGTVEQKNQPDSIYGDALETDEAVDTSFDFGENVKPATAFDQVDLFGNKTTPQTSQASMFDVGEPVDASGIQGAINKLKTKSGNETIVKDAEAALEVFNEATRTGTSVANHLKQQTFDGDTVADTLSPQAGTFLKAMEAGTFEQAVKSAQTSPLRQSADNIYNEKGDINYEHVKNVAGRVERGEQTIRRLDTAGEQGRIAGGQRSLEATVLLGADEARRQAASQGSGSNVESRSDTQSRQEKLLEGYAKREGIWYDWNMFFKDKHFTRGGEAFVYMQTPNTVAKTVDYRHIDKGLTPQQFLDNRIALFSHIFPGAKYELMGFTKDGNGKFRFLVKQTFFDAHGVSKADVNAYMKGKGFDEIGRESYGNDLYQVHDVHEKNALKDASGNIIVIDAVPKPRFEVEPFAVETVTSLRQVADTSQTETPVFFSQVERTIEQKMPNKASADQIRGILKDAKKEELEWLDLDSFLADNPNPTKQELLDYVRANNAEVTEVEKGGENSVGKSEREYQSELLDERDEIVLSDRDTAADRRRLREIEREVEESKRREKEHGSSGTKFSKYVLPGGENYRELLLTMPESRRVPTTVKIGADAYDVFDQEGKLYGSYSAISEAHALEKAVERGPTDARQKTAYKSSHWDEPNVLAHVRFDTRDGGKTLHVAEIQSDWHQAGRKRGYRDLRGTTENWYNANKEKEGWVEEWNDLPASERDALERIRQSTNIGTEVPDAPFKTSWPMMAFKRVLRHAVENGYERVTWDTGETNAERYDLSKQINGIYVAEDGKFKEVEIEPQSGDNITFSVREDGSIYDVTGGPDALAWEDKSLADVIGKEMADKIMSSIGEQSYEGLDLKIGGEGMRGFYDKILPASINKYVKKWGGKVESGTVKSSDVVDISRWKNIQITKDDVGEYEVTATDNETGNDVSLGFFDTKAEAEAEKGRYSGGSKTSVHSLTITPAMRDAVLKGQPLFQAASAAAKSKIADLRNVTSDELLPQVTGGKFVDDNLELNEADQELLRRLLGTEQKARTGDAGQQTSFYGILLDAPLLRRIAALGRVKQLPAYKKAGYTDADLKGYKELLKNLGELAAKAKDQGIAYVFDEALPEELVHQEDQRAGRTDGKALTLLIESPFFTDSGAVFAREYPSISKADKISEIAAKLITGQASKYGWDKLPNFGNLRTQFLNTWADGIVRNNKDFIEANGIKAFQERFKTIYENTTSDTARQTETQRSDSTDIVDRAESETVGDAKQAAEPDQRGRDNAEKENVKNRQFARSMTKHLMDIADVPYDPQSFKKWEEFGNSVIADKGIDGAIDVWRKMSGKDNEGRKTALGTMIAKGLVDAGRDGDYRIFGEELVNTVGNAAQELAAAKMLSRLNPDFAPIHGDKITRKAHNRPQTPQEYEKTKRLAEELKDASDREILAKESIEAADQRIANLEQQNAELEKLLKEENRRGKDTTSLEKALKAAKASAAYYKALVEEKRKNTPQAARTPAQIAKFKEKIAANRSDYMKRIRDAFDAGVLKQTADTALKQAAPLEINPELLEALTDLSAEKILNGLESGLTPEQFNRWLDRLTNNSLTDYEKAYIHAMGFNQIRVHKSLTPEAQAKLRTRYLHARVANQILQAEERAARAAASEAIKNADAFKYDKFARAMVDTAEKIDATDESVFVASLIRNYRDLGRIKDAYAEAGYKDFKKHFVEARNLIEATKAEIETARVEGKTGIENISRQERARFQRQERIARKEKFIKLKELDNHYKELTRSTAKKTLSSILDGWNLVRAVMFSMDAGFVLAQGGPTMITNPKGWWRAIKTGVPASAETPALNRWLRKAKVIGEDQGVGDWFRKIPAIDTGLNKLGFTGDKFMDAVVNAAESEYRARSESQGVKYETIGATQDWNESIMSKLSEKIPLVRQSNLAHSLVTDLFRLNQSERYLKWLDDMEAKGKIDAFQRNRAEEFIMKKWVNVMTGKGYLGPLDNFAWAAAQLMSAPRYTASAFQALYYSNPARIPFVPKGARAMVAQDTAKLYGTGAALTLLLGSLGWMTLDPEDKDFMVLDANKIPGLKNIAPDMKVALVRWLKEPFRLTFGLGLKYAAYQVMGNQDAADRIEKQWFNEFIASDFGGIGNYWRGRMHPAISMIRTNVTGENFVGDPVGWEDPEEYLPLPLTIKETIGALKYDRRESILKSGKGSPNPSENVHRMLISVIANGIGLGVNSYPSADTTVAGKQARAMMGSGSDSRTDAEKESSKIANQLERAIREGYDVTEELTAALAKGKINEKQAKTLQQQFVNEIGKFQKDFGVQLTEEQKQLLMSHRRAFKILDYLWGKGFQIDRDKVERTLEFATPSENYVNDRAAQAEAEAIILRSLLRSKKTSKPNAAKEKAKLEQIVGPEAQFWNVDNFISAYESPGYTDEERAVLMKEIKKRAINAKLKNKLQQFTIDRIQQIDPTFMPKK